MTFKISEYAEFISYFNSLFKGYHHLFQTGDRNGLTVNPQWASSINNCNGVWPIIIIFLN